MIKKGLMIKNLKVLFWVQYKCLWQAKPLLKNNEGPKFEIENPVCVLAVFHLCYDNLNYKLKIV